MLEKARFPSQNGPLAYEDTESIIMGLRSVDILSTAIFWHSNIFGFRLPLTSLNTSCNKIISKKC